MGINIDSPEFDGVVKQGQGVIIKADGLLQQANKTSAKVDEVVVEAANLMHNLKITERAANEAIFNTNKAVTESTTLVMRIKELLGGYEPEVAKVLRWAKRALISICVSAATLAGVAVLAVILVLL